MMPRRRPHDRAELLRLAAKHHRALAKINEELAAAELTTSAPVVVSSLSRDEVVALALENAQVRKTRAAGHPYNGADMLGGVPLAPREPRT